MKTTRIASYFLAIALASLPLLCGCAFDTRPNATADHVEVDLQRHEKLLLWFDGTEIEPCDGIQVHILWLGGGTDRTYESPNACMDATFSLVASNASIIRENTVLLLDFSRSIYSKGVGWTAVLSLPDVFGSDCDAHGESLPKGTFVLRVRILLNDKTILQEEMTIRISDHAT